MFRHDLPGIRISGCAVAMLLIGLGGGFRSASAYGPRAASQPFPDDSKSRTEFKGQLAQASSAPVRRIVDEMLKSVNSENALCVVLGSEDGDLTVALSRDGKYLVHGLCMHDKAVARTRAAIATAQLRGIVSAETGSIAKLPYSDNIVNLLVAENIGSLLQRGLTVQQILRVLRPGGIAWLGSRTTGTDALSARQLSDLLVKAGIKTPVVIKQDGVWVRLVKPRLASLGTWTHKRGDASGNPVSTDKQIGVPTGVRWVAGPSWPTGNRKSAIRAVVASKKQLVYVFQDEITSENGPRREDSLIARDAYNGLRLWRRKADSTEIVALADHVFTIVGGKLVALDSKTGRVTRTISVEGPRTFLISDGLLVVSGSKGITALDLTTGNSRWSAPHVPKTMRAGDGRLFVHIDRRRRGGDSQLICLDLKTGKQHWKTSTKSLTNTGSFDLIFYGAGVLVAASSRGNHAISAENGSRLWDYTYPRIGHGGSFTKVIAAKGLIWVHTANSLGTRQYAWEGLDPQTGKMKKRLLQPRNFRYKHRCSSDVATDNVFLCGSMDFADLKTGAYRHFEAARTSCRTGGLVPANGLVYTFPHACGCYSMLRGFLALETSPQAESSPVTATNLLEKGPAYGTEISRSKTAVSDWPTYRYDISRSGSTTTAGPEKLTKLWEQIVADHLPEAVAIEWDLKDGGRISSPVVAGGLAFIADSDHHRLIALNAGDGKRRWSFTTAGRIDCPPTINNGLCLFGSHDGYVYCVTASKGQLVWRRRAAPDARRIVAFGQLEAARPVVGSVLVSDGLAYFVAGRHSASDGGILVQAVEPKTGRLVWSSHAEGINGLPDILTGGSGTIQMASWEVDAKTGQKRNSGLRRLRGGRLGLLNDAWYKRPIAIRRNLSQWKVGNRLTGQMLAFNKTITCGYRACSKVDGGNGTMSGTALLFTAPANGKVWSVAMPTTARLRGMVLAGKKLYVAGLLYQDEQGNDATNGVRMYNLADGKLLAEYPIEDRLIHDCLAVAGGRLYVSTQNGKLICLGPK